MRAQRVAELDRLGRLDEHGRARGRFVVHDAADARARAAAHRDDVAPAPQRYGRVGRTLGRIERAENRFEALDQALARLAHCAAGARQGARRRVEHLALGIERRDEPLLERRRRRIDPELRGAGGVGCEPLKLGRDVAPGCERAAQLGERGTLEHAARHGEEGERGRDVRHGRSADRVIAEQQGRELGYLGERRADRRGIGGGRAVRDALGPERAGGVRRHARERGWELQCL